MGMKRSCRSSLAATGVCLLLVGLAIIATPIAHAVQAQVSTAQAKAVWARWKQLHDGTSDRAPVNAGEPVFWLRLRSCKLSTLVMQESDAEALHRYPAARRLESGGWVVFAHRDMHFRPLAGVRTGDEITVESAGGTLARYIVRTIRICLPEQVPSALEDPETRGDLHLLTCYPFHYIGSAPKRFLVTAVRSDH
jgi:sortase A